LKSPANIERFKKTFDFGEVVRAAICVADSDPEMENVVHHARLKNILEKLIVVNGPARLDLKYPSLTGCMGVSVEAFQYFTLAPKKDGDNDLVFAGLPLLDSKSQPFQTWAESGHNGVAMLIHRCTRIDSVADIFEESDEKKAEFRRR
jgi:hypothetical protein